MTPLAPGAVRLRGVSRSFRIFHERNLTLKETLLRSRRAAFTELWALRDVDLDIRPGEAVGIIGENGAGKSSLLKVVAGIIPPQTGTVETGGSVASMLELGAGFHPDFTGRENVYMNGAIHGLSEADVADRIDEIIAFAELADFIEMPVKTYSSGMYMRLAFAIASHVNPNILLLDEVLAVGDEAFQRKCMGRIFNYRRAGGTLLFVSHDAASVERVCDRAILLIGGRVVNDGPPMDVLNAYHRRLARPTAQNPDSSSPQHALGGDNEWGNGRVRILNPRLVGPEGPATNFASGDPVEVVFEVEATEPVPYPCFGIGLFTVDGHIVWGTNTQLESFTTDTIVGRRSVRFTLDQLPLHEGRFTLQVSAVSSDLSEVYHWIDRCLEFSVFQQDTGVGIVRMTGRWSLSQQEKKEMGPDNRAPVLEESAIPRLAKLLPSPVVVVDVGCRWGFADKWRALESHLEFVGFVQDTAECEKLSHDNAARLNFQFVCQTLGDREGDQKLHVTAQPACSSLYPPNQEVVATRPSLGDVVLVDETIVPITTLDRWTANTGLAPDFIRLSAQGAELDVLKGSERCLTKVRALQIDVPLNPIYRGQPLFGDVDKFLRDRGFVLWRLGHLVHYGLAEASPTFRLADRQFFDSRLIEISAQGGQVFWGHAWYVRAEAAAGIEASWEANLRDACVAAVLGFRDLARSAAERAAHSAPSETRPAFDLLAARA